MSLLIVTPIGLCIRFYHGFGNAWLDNISGEVLYEIFWMMLALLLFPRKSAVWPIAVGTLLFCCGIEFSQLWHPQFLAGFRSTAFGKLLIGSVFDLVDFLGYFIGCAIGTVWQFGWFAFMLRGSGKST